MSSLSPKQSEVLAFIESEISKTGRPPTYRDIAKHLGLEAVGTVQDHIRALIKKGFLLKEEGVARGFRLAHHAESSSIPILGSIPAGRPIEAIEDTQGSLSVPTRWKGDLFALKVKGDSMIEAGILDGDLAVIRKQQDASTGDIVVALIDGEATLKYLEKKAGKVRLLPANPKYSPIELRAGQENLIQGKLLSIQRYYS